MDESRTSGYVWLCLGALAKAVLHVHVCDRRNKLHKLFVSELRQNNVHQF